MAFTGRITAAVYSASMKGKPGKEKKSNNKAAFTGRFRLSKNSGLIRGGSPLWLNSDLATQGELPRRGKRRPLGGGAAENMEPQRASYFAGFAARRHAATGKFQPFSRGGTSCFMHGKTRKSGIQPFFRQPLFSFDYRHNPMKNRGRSI